MSVSRLCLVTVLLAFGVLAFADDRGEALFETRCASCHAGGGGSKAPLLSSLKQMHQARIYAALTSGSMKAHAAGLEFGDLRALVNFIGARSGPLAGLEDAMCVAAKRTVGVAHTAVARWGFEAGNTRYQDAGATAIRADNVADLELAWAFAVPNTSSMRSQPAITGDAVFLATTSGKLFALARDTGCIKWIFDSAAPFRTGVALGVAGDGRTALYVGDAGAGVSAVDARSGELIWRTDVGLSPFSTTTGTPVQHGDRLFVPLSSHEVGVASRDEHECCRSHGAVLALDVGDGRVLWTAHMTPEAKPTGTSSAGTQQWGPSGAPVWSSPTVDAKRNVIYVGTGQNTSLPASAMSDSVVAIDMDSGTVRWSYQGTKGDVYNMACGRRRGANCPEEAGPDFDFGAAVILTQDSEGQDILLAGQKSGTVHALDPDRDGALLWKRSLSDGTALGGIHWGMATDGRALFVPVADPPFPRPGYTPRPALHALSIDDGEEIWVERPSRGCKISMQAYFQRTSPWPDCSLFFGYSAAAAAVPGVVFAGGLDGTLTAYDSASGAVLWQVETARPFESRTGVEAHGGAIDNAAIVPAGNMLFVSSGYALFGQLPGNVLLAYELPAPTVAGSK